MTVATPLLTKKLWWFVLVWLWHKHLSLSHWGIFPQYEDHNHHAAADAMKDNYNQYLQLPSIHQGTSILAMRSNGPLPQVQAYNSIQAYNTYHLSTDNKT